MSNEKKVIELCIKGDESAKKELYKLYYKKIYFFCLKNLKNDTDALDAMQDVFLAVFKYIFTLNSADRFNAWIYKIALNRCKRNSVKNSKIVFVDEYTDNSNIIINEDESNDPDKVNEKNNVSKMLLKAIDSLSEKKRNVILLYYYSGLKIDEISKVIEIPEGTVKTRLKSGKEDLKRIIESNKSYTSMYSFSWFISLLLIKYAKMGFTPDIENISFDKINEGFNVGEATFAKNKFKLIKAKSMSAMATTMITSVVVGGVGYNYYDYGKENIDDTIIALNKDDEYVEEKFVYKDNKEEKDNISKQDYIINNEIIIKDEKPIIYADDKEVRLNSNFDPLEDIIGIDKEDGYITEKIKIVENTVDTQILGDYKIKYELTDSNKNTVSKIINIIIVDKENLPPTIIVTGDIIIGVGEVDNFNYLEGVEVKDDNDDLKLENIVIIGEITKPKSGENKDSLLTYTIVDSVGEIGKKTRKITVTNQLPEIQGLTEIIIEKGSTVDLEIDVLAIDLEDGNITKNILYPNGGYENKNIESKNLKAGVHKLYYTIVDSDGNEVVKMRLVIVNETKDKKIAKPKNVYFTESGIVINGNVEERNYDENVEKYLIMKDKNEDIVKEIKITNNDFYAEVGNYSGYEAIISIDILKEIGDIEGAKLCIKTTYNMESEEFLIEEGELSTEEIEIPLIKPIPDLNGSWISNNYEYMNLIPIVEFEDVVVKLTTNFNGGLILSSTIKMK